MTNKYKVYINSRLVITGVFLSSFAAFLAAADLFGNRSVGSIVVRVVK